MGLIADPLTLVVLAGPPPYSALRAWLPLPGAERELALLLEGGCAEVGRTEDWEEAARMLEAREESER